MPGPRSRRRSPAIAAAIRAVAVVALLASCEQPSPSPSPAGSDAAAVTRPPASTPAPTAAPTPVAPATDAPTRTAAPEGAAEGYPTRLPLRAREDTWLRVLGAPDDMAGTAIVPLDAGYVAAVGFTPGSRGDVGLVRFGADGRVTQARRYVSDRDRTGGLHGTSAGRTVWVQAVPIAAGRLALGFDDVWLPDVGDEATVVGWQIALPSDAGRRLLITDLVSADGATYLRAVVGTVAEAHLAILRVAANGRLDWAVEYPDVRTATWVPYAGVGPRPGGRIFLTADGSLLTGGYLRGVQGEERAVVLWIDPADGSLGRTVTVEMEPYRLHPTAPLARSRRFQDLALLPGGDIVLVQDADVCSVACHDGGALITRLTPTGGHRWTVGLHALDDIGGVTFVSDVREDGDRLLVVGGSTAFASPADRLAHVNLLMASLDASGRPVWVRSLGTPKVSSSANEFKTDFANALLPTGDGRMVVAGTTSSFGSHQVYDGLPYVEHRDLVLGMAGLDNGGIRGASHLLWSPDVEDPYQVWSESRAVVVGSCDACGQQPLDGADLRPVTYRAEDMDLVARDLAGGVPDDLRGLHFTFGQSGRVITSSTTFFAEGGPDPDGDGLDQDWEDFALEQVKPIIELDEKEPWLDEQDEHYVALLTRVSPYPASGDPDYIVFGYAISWSKDYGGADTFEVHRGDIELASLAYRVTGERSLRLEWVYTSAHGETNSHSGVWSADDPTCNRGSIADTGYLTLSDPESVGTELMCAPITLSRNRVKLQASESKHAMYPNKDVCENHATLVALAGGAVWGEDCGGGGDRLFDAYNIGEPNGTLLVDDLGNSSGWSRFTQAQVEALVRMFPNERVREGNRDKPGQFCGGLLAPPDACCGTTVGNKVGDPLPGILEAKLGPPTYRVVVKTATDAFAGTDAGVYITLFGADGRAIREELDGSFERGSVDVFRFGDPSTYVGDIARIGLERDPDEPNPDMYIDLYGLFELDHAAPSPDWKVKEVLVEDLATGRTWTFTIDSDLTDASRHDFLP